MSSLYEQIKADLGYLKLDAAAGVFATLAEQAKLEDWSHIEFLARLVAEQATADRDRRLAARLRYARFPYRRSINDFDYEFQPSVDRKLVEDLATLRFIDENRPILLLGQPGCGKTHLAVALATIAVEAGYRGYFTTADNLCRTLVRASIEGNLASKMKTFTAPTVLVIDDVGLLPIGGTEACRGVLPSRQHPLRPRPPHQVGQRLERPRLDVVKHLPNPLLHPRARVLTHPAETGSTRAGLDPVDHDLNRNQRARRQRPSKAVNATRPMQRNAQVHRIASPVRRWHGDVQRVRLQIRRKPSNSLARSPSRSRNSGHSANTRHNAATVARSRPSNVTRSAGDVHVCTAMGLPPP